MNQEDLWKRFYAVVGGEPQLYALKQIVTYLLNLIADPKASSKDIARVVSSDPALSANVHDIGKILSSVNSVNPYSGKKPETLVSENLLAEVGLSKGRFQDVLTI
ncbi:MAG: HDOD domain-containing protein, partial [Candidatus Eremiobacteraeota bacterium]|nr:HDOD domain-containing protein [Candidatus Eremiobacteraeota bacterium]